MKLEGGEYLCGQFLNSIVSFEAQVVTGSFHFQQTVFRRDQAERLLHFLDAAKRVACSVHEQARSAQVGQMLNTKLLPFARRMQWVRKHKKSGHQLGFGCAEYGRLAPTVGASAEKNPPRDFLAQGCNRVAETLAIAVC